MSSGGQQGTPITGSPYNTLTSAIIEARVRQITRRDNLTDYPSSDVTALTAEACREISKRTLVLKSSDADSLAANSNSFTIPADMIPQTSAIDQLYFDSKLLDPITYDEWLQNKMSGWAYRDGVIYIRQAPDTSKSYTLYYSKYHPASVTSIILNDDFKMAIVFYVCSKVYDDHEMPDKGLQNLQKYEIELAKNTPAEMAVGRQRQFRG